MRMWCAQIFFPNFLCRGTAKWLRLAGIPWVSSTWLKPCEADRTLASSGECKGLCYSCGSGEGRLGEDPSNQTRNDLMWLSSRFSWDFWLSTYTLTTRGLEGHRQGFCNGVGVWGGYPRTLLHCIVRFNKICVELWLIPWWGQPPQPTVTSGPKVIQKYGIW